MHLGFPKIAYPGNPCLSVPGNLCHSFPQLHRSPALPHPCAIAPVASFSRSPLYLHLGCFQYFTTTNNAARITMRIGFFLLFEVFLQGTVLEVGFLGQTVNTYIVCWLAFSCTPYVLLRRHSHSSPDRCCQVFSYFSKCFFRVQF